MKLTKSGGVVTRSKEVRQQARKLRVEEYFYGMMKVRVHPLPCCVPPACFNLDSLEQHYTQEQLSYPVDMLICLAHLPLLLVGYPCHIGRPGTVCNTSRPVAGLSGLH